MMVSEQARSVQSTTSGSSSSESSSSASNGDAAIAFPAALATTDAAAMMDASVFASFEEQLMSMPANLAQQADPAAAAAAAAAIGAAFFIDTAAIAQQIAASVSDEKKLSDNILDLIPPPQPTDAASASATATAAAAAASRHAASAFAMPLGPPPGLMDMRLLSPPMNLLPDLSTPMPTLSLDAAAASTVSAPATTTTTTTTAPPATTATTATTPTVITTAEDRRKAAFAAASVLKKRKSSDAFATDATAQQSTTAPPAPGTTTSSINTTSTTRTTPATPVSTTTSIPTPTAAALQTLAREKVMKEPQSGDLYECVITKRNGGLGLTLACVDDHVQITGLAPDTPAANSGICVGDTLVAVSGLPVRGLQFSTVIGRLKSSSRNSVVLKLRRNPFRHNGSGNGLPYRSANGVGMGLKRPSRPMAKTPESNSANVLSNTKSMALETRLAGPSGVVNHAQSLVDAAHSNSTSNGSTSATSAPAFHIKTEPTASVYLSEPSSSSSSSSSSIGITTLGESATTVQPKWRVAEEDRDRYYSETRRLRQELAHAMAWRRRERSAQEVLHQQFQSIAHKFESEMQTIFQIGAPAAVNGATPSPTDSSSVAKSHHEDLVALRQKLLEVNHALARQQTEILELKERDARHTFHELRRVKAEIVSGIQKHMHDLVMTGASSQRIGANGQPVTRAFEDRIEGVRSSVFEHLFQQQSSTTVAAKLLAARHQHHHHQHQHQHQHHRPSSLLAAASGAVKEEKTASIDLDLDVTQTMEVLGWNLRERLPARSLLVRVAGGCKAEYVTHDEALTLRYQLELVEAKP